MFNDKEEREETRLFLNELLNLIKGFLKENESDYIETINYYIDKLTKTNIFNIKRYYYLNTTERKILIQYLTIYNNYLINININNSNLIELLNIKIENYPNEEKYDKFVNKIRTEFIKDIRFLDDYFKKIILSKGKNINEKIILKKYYTITKILNNELSYLKLNEIKELKERLIIWKYWIKSIINDENYLIHIDRINILLDIIDKRLSYYNHNIYVISSNSTKNDQIIECYKYYDVLREQDETKRK